ARHRLARHLRLRWQAVDLGPVHQQVERVQAAEHLLVSAVQPCPRLALPVQLSEPGLRVLAELGDRPEPDRAGRARLGAGRLQAGAEAVVTEGALLGDTRPFAHVDDAEGAGADAVAAAVAGRLLDVDRVELGADDGAGRAHLQAGGVDAVLAD